MSIFYNLFGSLMKFIYDTVSFQNYGIAIIIFTILTKALLSPFTIKSMKSSSQNVEMQKEIAEVNKLFKGDKQRILEETQKIHSKYGFSMAAGCLPTLLQFPIIIVLFEVVQKPITYIMGKGAGVIDPALKILDINKTGYYELDLMNRLASDPALINDKISGFRGIEELINFDFLGINLGMKPVFDFSLISDKPGVYLPLLMIPILAAVTTYLQSVLMNKMTKARNGGVDQPGAAGMMKSMTFMMPVMIMFFAFNCPASLGLYWITGNVFAIIQQYLMGKMMNKKNKDKKDNDIIDVKGKRV